MSEPQETFSPKTVRTVFKTGEFVEDAELGKRFAAAFKKSFEGFFTVNGLEYEGRRQEPQPPPPKPTPPPTMEPVRIVSARARAAYAVLGIPVSSSPEETRSAYRALAMRLHPDLGGDEQAMKRLNAAYEVLVRAGMA